MDLNLRPADELDKEIEQASKKITERYDFFNYLRGFDFGVKDVLSSIRVEKYDEGIKDYDGLQFYMALKKRVEIIEEIEYSKHLDNETYHNYLDDFTDDDIEDEITPYPLSEQDFNNNKAESIRAELRSAIDLLEMIFYGDPLAITKDDIRNLERDNLRSGVVSIDMADIAFRNRYNGFMGGMGDKDCNIIISSVILNDVNSSTLGKLKQIPDGYGWEAGALSRNTIWAEIDLDVPDDILVEAFKNWLDYAREKHDEVFGGDNKNEEIKNHFKVSLLKRWRGLRVLAYLDMKILSDFFNQTPTLKQYGDVLYFDEYDVDTTEKVRKTLLPVVQDIFKGRTLEHLLSKIMAEGKIPK